jgi:small GTP-binding protein
MTDCEIYKLILVGDSYVGKTKIANILANRYFDDCDQSITTIGLDIIIKDIFINNEQIKLHIWDTAGQERFSFIISQYFRCVNGVIMIYDVTNIDSFNHLNYWLNLIISNLPINENIIPEEHSEIPLILIGNKIDKSNRVVTYEIGKSFADENKMHYYEISAKEKFDYNIILFDLIEQIKLSKKNNKKINSVDIKKRNNYYCCNI